VHSARAAALVAALVLTACGGSATAGQGAASAKEKLTVFAAASLQPPFDNIAKKLGQMTITFNYAGTQTLTSQLSQGAQADVFAAADTAHMKTVENAGLVDGSPSLFAHNRLEIAVEKGNPKDIRSLSDLARPGIVVVLADPSVPAGKYAQQALARAGVTVHARSLETEVTGVLSKVALGEADAGIVYISDVATSGGKVDGVSIPDAQNVIADYPIAKLKGTRDSSAADALIAYVLSPQGQQILVAAGFETA